MKERRFKLMLSEMDKINKSEISRAARQHRINVFLYPVDKTTGDKIDINGTNPGCDFCSSKDVKTALLAYYDNEITVWSIFEQGKCTPTELYNTHGEYKCVFVDAYGKEQTLYFNFWTY